VTSFTSSALSGTSVVATGVTDEYSDPETCSSAGNIAEALGPKQERKPRVSAGDYIDTCRHTYIHTYIHTYTYSDDILLHTYIISYTKVE